MTIKPNVLRPGGPSDLEMEDMIASLKKMGLSDYEAKAYIALIRRSYGSAEDVSDVAGIPRTSAYKVLESLQKKSFVNNRGSTAVFHPVPPEHRTGSQRNWSERSRTLIL